MIASLALTIYLICGVPVIAEAEMGGSVHRAEILEYEFTDRGLAYSIKEGPYLIFHQAVISRMKKEGIQPQPISLSGECQST